MIIFGFSAFRAERTLIKETVYLLRRPKNMLLESRFFLFIISMKPRKFKILKLVIIFFFAQFNHLSEQTKKENKTSFKI